MKEESMNLLINRLMEKVEEFGNIFLIIKDKKAILCAGPENYEEDIHDFKEYFMEIDSNEILNDRYEVYGYLDLKKRFGAIIIEKEDKPIDINSVKESLERNNIEDDLVDDVINVMFPEPMPKLEILNYILKKKKKEEKIAMPLVLPSPRLPTPTEVEGIEELKVIRSQSGVFIEEIYKVEEEIIELVLESAPIIGYQKTKEERGVVNLSKEFEGLGRINIFVDKLRKIIVMNMIILTPDKPGQYIEFLRTELLKLLERRKG